MLGLHVMELQHFNHRKSLTSQGILRVEILGNTWLSSNRVRSTNAKTKF